MSNLSDYLNKPYPGLTKPDDNTLRLLRPLPELQAIASDATVTGINAGVLRLRNVYQANSAGPNIYLEGTNSGGTVKTVGRVQAVFTTVTAASERTKLALYVLQAGAALSVELRGDATANFSPSAIATAGLGSQTLPWLEAWVGNAGGTKYVKLTSTGPGSENAIITEASALVLYHGAAATYSFGATAFSQKSTGSALSTIYAGSDTANTNFLQTTVATSGITINSSKAGTGTTQAVSFQSAGTTQLQLATNGDVIAGKASLATGNTDGHLYIPAVAGVMTGVPTSRAGFVPIYFDTTNLKIGVYTGGAWKHTAALI